VIRATSSGIVLRSSLRNVEQVVRTGDSLVEIAPSNNALVIKAKVATQSVDKVKTGQLPQLRISACPYSDYGTLQGIVMAVSPDAIAPTITDSSTATMQFLHSSNANYYEVTIQPNQLSLEQGNRQCQLRTGMKAEANTISKQETFLQFGSRKTRLLINL
jgi:HlyD family secretion protein